MTSKLKIVKSGSSTSTTDLTKILLDSQYGMFKYHRDVTTSITLSAGDTTGSTTYAHGLGYTPAFIAYLGDGGAISSLPRRDIVGLSGVDRAWFTYADDTNIYIKYRSVIPLNQETYTAVDAYGSYLGRGYTEIGNYPGYGDALSCALRFDNINVNGTQTINSAILNYRATIKGSGTDDVDMTTYGIDEDDTSAFTSDPLGRTKTTASVSQSQAPSTTPFSFGINVLSSFNEIRQRANWSSGNAMGFLVVDAGTSANSYFRSTTTYNSLVIVKAGTYTYNFRIIIFKDQIST